MNTRQLGRGLLSIVVGAAVVGTGQDALAAVVDLPYVQDFQSVAPSSDAGFDYPEFDANLNGGIAVVDSDGVLHFNGFAESDQDFTVSLPAGQTDEIVIRGQLGASNSNGNYHVALLVGQNAIAFHPGFGGPGMFGAFRIAGPGGMIQSNSDMGFVPANGVLHQFEVHSFPNGDFDVTVTDGANPENVYTTTFNAPAAYGGPVGFRRSGPAFGDGMFDNLEITVVPEPTLLAPVAFGLLALARPRRRA
jgi:hypothetical protein